MNSGTRYSLQAFSVLLEREWRAICKSLPRFIEGTIWALFFQVLLLRFFLPTMGMNPAYKIPLFIGNIIMLCFMLGYQIGISHTLDLDEQKVFVYHSMLPISRSWVVAARVIGIMIRLMMITLPAGVIGLSLVGVQKPLEISFFSAVIMYLLTVLFFSLFFFSLATFFKPVTYFERLWPRFLSPFFAFGSIFYTWGRINNFNPYLGTLFLCNPVTYCTEGLRSAIVSPTEYLPLYWCIPVVFLSCVVLFFITQWALMSRLDPVRGA